MLSFTVLVVPQSGESETILRSVVTAPIADWDENHSFRVTRQVEIAALEEVETLEDRVYHASLQVKVLQSYYWTVLIAHYCTIINRITNQVMICDFLMVYIKCKL